MTGSDSTAATLPIRVKPGSSVTSVGGGYDGPHGRALVVSVHARAVEGQANAAVIRAVADALDVPRSSITVRLGTTSRNKVLAIASPPPEMAARVRDLLAR